MVTRKKISSIVLNHGCKGELMVGELVGGGGTA